MKPGTCRLVGLRGYLNDRPPAELEATFYVRNGPNTHCWKSSSPSLHQNQGDSVIRLGSAFGAAP
jgi:hypothetical protein